MTRRHPSREERALWLAAMRDVARLEPGAVPPPDPAPEAPPQPRAPAEEAAPPPPRAPAGIDRRSAERLRRGQLPIEARLDLHGMTQAEAHDALAGFIARAQEDGLRCVLVITGKGGERGGVLREAVPRWLEEAPNKGHVLATAPAQSRHGGAGARYLLLRRRR